MISPITFYNTIAFRRLFIVFGPKFGEKVFLLICHAITVGQPLEEPEGPPCILSADRF